MEKFNPEEAILNTKREFGEHGGVSPSLSRSSTFTVKEPGIMPEIFEGIKGPDRGGCYLYSRHFNPTVSLLARYLAAMEDTESAKCTASGMSAIACTVLQICKSGDHIVSGNSIYGGTYALFKDLLPDYNIETTFVDTSDYNAFEKAIKPETKIIYVESLSNPTLQVPDIKRLAVLAKKNDIKLVVDNTFLPVVLSPARLGADVVVYSMTKFINGASDLIAGAICASKEFINELVDVHTGRVMLYGPTLDPRVAFDIIQRVPHLPLRMKEHGSRTLELTEMLNDMGVKVKFPGLKSHPDNKLLSSILNEGYGYGGVFTIDCETEEKANDLLSTLQNEEDFGYIAVSLGYFDTLISCSGSSTSSEMTPEEQKEIGLSPGLVRISTGLTGSIEMRKEQLKRAVTKVLL
ncbi:MAG: aminotransferase class I/II-fold pyridoxal phosphate-dependent enzyme [Desulfobacterales bacterium]|nr:aminotransferase class I/II-fold pyridoxal phosphate-dependent enzyme [Desulfobacterales bacterium]MCP4159455.1 aminotransferase class I/II-fold pyridoxal phosphate-dependent enzyme [Deltaproteobacteria bacterium]